MQKNNVAKRSSSPRAAHHYLLVLVLPVVSALLLPILPSFYSEHFNSSLTTSTVLIHCLSGLIAVLLMITFVWYHLRTTLTTRNSVRALSGWFLLILALIVACSGIYFSARNASADWVSDFHAWASYFFVLIVFFHINWKQFVNKLLERKKGLVSVVFLSIGLCLLVALTQQVSEVFINDTESELSIWGLGQEAYSYEYGDNPFYPAESSTFNGQFINESSLGGSHRCADCHYDIAREWMSSAHSQAASDPAYIKNIKLLVSKKGIAAARYCEGCHAPVALLSGNLTEGGKHGGIEDTIANDEGVTCRTCHRIDEVLHTRGNGSYKLADLRKTTVEPSSLFSGMSDIALMARPSDHRMEMGNPVLKTSEMCATCHAQFMDKNINQWGWVQMQNEYSAWASSPFSHRSTSQMLSASVKSCQACHMPLVPSSDPSANRDGMIKSHRFPAANTFLPFINGDQIQLQKVQEFLQANRVGVSVIEPEYRDRVRNQLAGSSAVVDSSETPFFWYLGENQVNLTVAITNYGVGHNFPGGTIDLSEAWVELDIRDAENHTVYFNGHEDVTDSKTTSWMYRSIPIDRFGAHVWKHDLFNMIGDSFKRVIRPGETDLAYYSFNIPAWAKSPLTVTASLKYRKLNKQYREWVMDGPIDLPDVTIGWDTLLIPVVERDEVRAR